MGRGVSPRSATHRQKTYVMTKSCRVMVQAKGSPPQGVGRRLTALLLAAAMVLVAVPLAVPSVSADQEHSVRALNVVCIDGHDEDVGVGAVAHVRLCAIATNDGCAIDIEADVVGGSAVSEYRWVFGYNPSDGSTVEDWGYEPHGPIIDHWRPRPVLIGNGEDITAWAGISDLTLGGGADARVSYTCSFFA